MSQTNQNDATATRQSTLSSRHTVKPSDPGYDAHVLAHLKAKLVVDPVRGCWLWQGFIFPDTKLKSGKVVKGGYGAIGYRGRTLAVHRVMWMLHTGQTQPKKMDICHECDVRHCCNPDHLWLGTRRQNLQDMANKGRGLCGAKAAQTHCIRNHPLSGDNVYLTNNGRRRGCKACDRIHQKKYWDDGRAKARQKRYRDRMRAQKQAVAS